MKPSRIYQRFPFSVVLYDHSCVICRNEMLRLQKLDKQQCLHLVDISNDKFSHEFWGFSNAELNKSLHVRNAQGQWLTGMQAIRHVYEQVGLGWIWLPSRLPGLKLLSDILYRLFARNRYRLSRWLIALGVANSKSRCNDISCQKKTG